MNFLFDATQYPYPSRRRVIFAHKGMVCTSQPLAAQAGLKILQQGGNAIDAAIATAACLTVVEPTGNGLGSDSFALVWVKDKLYGLNGSGYAPQLMTAAKLQSMGVQDKIPDRGWLPVTVPGTPSAWAELHKRFGKLPFQQVLQPAIEYAEEGYPVSPIVQKFWQKGLELFSQFREKPEFAGWFQTFAPQGTIPKVGELVKLPQHARTLRLIANSYAEAFYQGEVADAIDAFSKETGGLIRKKDLQAYKAEWVEPISINYKGYDVWEIPPNGHGITALMALNILRGYTFTARETIEAYHHQIEAMKLAFADGMKYVADARYMQTKVQDMLSEAYACQRRRLIGQQAIMPEAGRPYSGGTVYMCTADNEGNMVSFIQSNYKGFGSGIVIPGYGLALNDRGCGFSMDSTSDNYVLPGKKPYHTIIPGFLTKEGKAVGLFGVMGGYMQPQGHVQVITNTIDFMLNPQAALDAPRWQWVSGRKVQIEDRVSPEIIEQLVAMGHEVEVMHDYTGFGRGQIIWRDENGVLAGATEPRTDGTVAAW
ncbi:MAG: gamma-glutamyltransferase [Phascolarctobacterium sp.]|nr:gamma-glutamyltransferase [Phascolarctobacterium sp.]